MALALWDLAPRDTSGTNTSQGLDSYLHSHFEVCISTWTLVDAGRRSLSSTDCYTDRAWLSLIAWFVNNHGPELANIRPLDVTALFGGAVGISHRSWR